MALCWFYRKAIARRFAAGLPLSEGIQGHLEHCPECRDFGRSHEQLTARLIREADHQRVETPPFLRGRIMSSLDRAQSDSVPNAVRFQWSAAAVAAAVVLLGGLAGYQYHLSIRRAADAPVILSQPSLLLPKQLPSGEKLLEWSHSLEQPLETEWQSVVTDAKTAVRLLADNFLPDHLLAASVGDSPDR